MRILTNIMPILLLLLLLQAATACNSDLAPVEPAADGIGDVRFTLNLPMGEAATRTGEVEVDENQINTFNVLLFSDGIYRGTAWTLNRKDEGSSVTFIAQIDPGTYDVVVVANAASLIDRITADNTIKAGISTKTEVMEALVFSETDIERYIPAWGEERTLKIIKGESPSVEMELSRVVARIDVQLSAGFPSSSPFVLTGVHLCNRSTKGSLIGIPDECGTAPGAANAKAYTDVTDGKSLIGKIYTFEAPDGIGMGLTSGWENNVCLVVEGTYNGMTCYYRVDFINSQGSPGAGLERDHCYEVTINDVLYFGQQTLADALKTSPGDIDVSVKGWKPATVDSTLEGPYSLSVARRKVYISNAAYTTSTNTAYRTTVSTNYKKGWTATSENSDWLTVAINNGAGVESVSSTSNATNNLYIRVTKNPDSSSDRIGYITITAGKLVHQIQVIQRCFTGVKFYVGNTAVTACTFTANAYGSTPSLQNITVKWYGTGDLNITKTTTLSTTVVEAVEWNFPLTTTLYSEKGECEQTYTVRPYATPSNWHWVWAGQTTTPQRESVYTFGSVTPNTLKLTHNR